MNSLGQEKFIALSVKSIKKNLKNVKYHMFVVKYYFFLVFVTITDIKMKKYLKKSI